MDYRLPQSRVHLLLKTIVITAACSTSLVSSPAFAGGYDQPVTFNARHAGMAGTGISYVEGGLAMHLNPAGMGQVGKGSLDIAASIIDVRTRSTPSFLSPDANLYTDRIPVVLPLLAGAYRINKYLTVGAAIYPAAGLAGQFVYLETPTAEEPIVDEIELLFLEVTGGLAVNFDEIGLRIGAGYRFNYGRLDRTRPDMVTNLGFELSGIDWKGFRVGFQWQITDYFVIGAVFRNKVRVNVSGSGQALGSEFDRVALDIVLPARTGGGFRFDTGPFGFSADFEWLFNSQNDFISINTVPDPPFPLANRFDWSDQWILRMGVEYRLFDDHWPIRLGFAYESATSSIRFPQGFGGPPVHSPLVTIGTGYNHGPWQFNVAYVRGFQSIFVDDEQNPQTPDPSDDALTSQLFAECPNCGGSGQYDLRANQFYFDFSYNWR